MTYKIKQKNIEKLKAYLKKVNKNKKNNYGKRDIRS